MKKLGFLGAGNMARALVKGLLETKRYRAADLWASDPERAALRELRRAYHVDGAPDNPTIVAGSEVVVLAVKPQIVDAVLREVRSVISRRQLFISIAAGIATARLEAGLGPAARVIRVMPNTPALVGRGMSVLVRGRRASAADERCAATIFGGVGDVEHVRDEALMDVVTGLSGSGPAYVYRFAEALIAGAVVEGLSEALARHLTFQTLCGAAAMLRETGCSPEELRAMVSSPGGTTVAGLRALDDREFVSIVAGAVAAATRRSRELGQG